MEGARGGVVPGFAGAVGAPPGPLIAVGALLGFADGAAALVFDDGPPAVADVPPPLVFDDGPPALALAEGAGTSEMAWALALAGALGVTAGATAVAPGGSAGRGATAGITEVGPAGGEPDAAFSIVVETTVQPTTAMTNKAADNAATTMMVLRRGGVTEAGIASVVARVMVPASLIVAIVGNADESFDQSGV